MDSPTEGLSENEKEDKAYCTRNKLQAFVITTEASKRQKRLELEAKNSVRSCQRALHLKDQIFFYKTNIHALIKKSKMAFVDWIPPQTTYEKHDKEYTLREVLVYKIWIKLQLKLEVLMY